MRNLWEGWGRTFWQERFQGSHIGGLDTNNEVKPRRSAALAALVRFYRIG